MSNVVAFKPVEPPTPAPQKERKAVLDDGFIRIANELRKAKAKAQLSGIQRQVLDAVEDFTFGWNKSSDRVANCQIADYCDLQEPRVSEAMKELEERKFITRVGDHRKAKVVSINTFTAEWLLRKTVRTVTQNRNERYGKAESEIRKTVNTQDIITQDNNKDLVVGKNPTTPPKSKYQFSDDDLTTAKWMAERVMKIAPKSKAPNAESWANEIRLMREQDGHSLADICQLFAWCNKHHFHYKNIQSPSKLRKRFGELHSEMCPPADLDMPAKGAAKPDVDWNDKSWAVGFNPEEGL